ncbi:MAG: SDR family oxidoreductase [Deltaproteobacteria bacterium]|nr:SDR family oxidoreductase [Deltaproteobacteria bacterium]MCW5804610.1 SDR family oxidoreductase [Deltaproteobacteria bacterium]
MTTSFAGRHVAVTGGHGALGVGVVEVLARSGATLHVSPLEVRIDDEAQTAAWYASLPGLWASVHLVGGFAMKAFGDTTLAELEQQWRINTVTCFLACREALRAIRRGGAGGRIVNVASRPAVSPAANMAAYASSKAAVASLTQTLAAEVVGENILVNAILPSIIDTPANRAAMPKADHASWPTPAQLGEEIAFLASPANTLTTGALVPVYGRA